jgi:hypothetical protein
MWHRKPRPGSLDNAFITGVDQVCTVTRDFDATIQLLTEKWGIGPFKCWELKAPALFNTTFRGKESEWSMRLGVALVGRMQWEVIQPLDGASLYAEHLEKHGDGIHHILLETAGSHADALARVELAQSAMLNLPLKLGALTVPAAPKVLANSLSTQFGYADTHDQLGTTLELAKFPPGISRALGLRIGKADFVVPSDGRITDSLPNSFIDRVEKLGFIVDDLNATVRNWADRFGVGPWHIVELGPESIGEINLQFRARAAWAMVGSTLFEVIQPIAGDTPHSRLLKQKGPGLHYLGVRSEVVAIDDIPNPIMKGVLFGGHQFALVDAGALWLEFISLDAEPLFQQLQRLEPAQRYPA